MGTLTYTVRDKFRREHEGKRRNVRTCWAVPNGFIIKYEDGSEERVDGEVIKRSLQENE